MASAVKKRSSQPSPLSQPNIESVKIRSERLDVDFLVCVQDQTDNMVEQKIFCMTVHDLGTDYTSFLDFIACEEMKNLRDRIVWIHVNLPGQEVNAEDINVEYPTLDETAEELVIIIDKLKIDQVVCLGEGCGANIVARFAMIHPNRCLGVALLHPTVKEASLGQTLKEKISSILPSSLHDSYLTWHRFGHADSQNELINEKIKQFHKMVSKCRNQKNLTALVDCYLNRTNLIDKIEDLKVDVLIAVGRKASLQNEAIKFYQALTMSRAEHPETLSNCPFLDLENVCDIMVEAPDKLAVSLRYFLQGMSLVPPQPVKHTQPAWMSITPLRPRAFSLDEPKRPFTRRFSSFK